MYCHSEKLDVIEGTLKLYDETKINTNVNISGICQFIMRELSISDNQVNRRKSE